MIRRLFVYLYPFKKNLILHNRIFEYSKDELQKITLSIEDKTRFQNDDELKRLLIDREMYKRLI